MWVACVISVNGMIEKMGIRIKSLRRKRGLSQMELGVEMDERYGQTMISAVELGKRLLSVDGLVSAARALDTSADYLLGITDSPGPLGGQGAGYGGECGMLFGKPASWFPENGDAIEMTGADGPLSIDLHPVPILGVIRDTMIYEEPGLGNFDVPITVIQEAPKAFALRAMDHSLAPLHIFLGNLLIVDPEGPLIEGKMYVIWLNGEERASIRRLWRNGPRLTVMDSKGETVSVSPDQVEVAGRVRWAMLEL